MEDMTHPIKDLNGAVQDRFRDTMDVIAESCWRNSEDHGFHTARKVSDPDKTIRDMSDATALMLIVSELSEAMEALRHGNPPSDKIDNFSGMEEELADACIRIFDLCVSRGFLLGDAILAKMSFNETRPFMHGDKSV
jgi:NTP pyrophosphatase (non-canonical NTP hydrolase)